MDYFTTDHHETVGQVERGNSFIEQYLRYTNLKIARNISENFNHIKDTMIRSKELYKNVADKKRMQASVFKEGDLVWIQLPPSFNT
ncbi:hypothetical protein PIROE2DRAFT_12110 [Piromyces sp. E2]|nr:hypothetical protein PIROE2DRAFT_12110 [Piromyces sp. E2]|eukprot:OUM61806.1 hypothetical protein PIROE2DRAFT_12110 [Piromyces sp. E2]